MVSRGGTDRLPTCTPVFTENTLSSNYKNCFVCLGTTVKRTLALEDSHDKKTYTYVRLQANCLLFVSDFNQIRDSSKILGANSDMKF